MGIRFSGSGSAANSWLAVVTLASESSMDSGASNTFSMTCATSTAVGVGGVLAPDMPPNNNANESSPIMINSIVSLLYMWIPLKAWRFRSSSCINGDFSPGSVRVVVDLHGLADLIPLVVDPAVIHRDKPVEGLSIRFVIDDIADRLAHDHAIQAFFEAVQGALLVRHLAQLMLGAGDV